jgi:hypothetical protein
MTTAMSRVRSDSGKEMAQELAQSPLLSRGRPSSIVGRLKAGGGSCAGRGSTERSSCSREV